MNSLGNSFPFIENAEKIQSDGITANATLTGIKGIDTVSYTHLTLPTKA